MDSRKRVIEAYDQDETIVQVAQGFAVSPSFVNKLQQRRRECGTLEPKPHGGGRQPLLSLEHDDMLRTLLAAKPDTTLVELREKLGLKVHLSSLWYRLRRLGLTFKKTQTAAEHARKDVRLQRDAWQKLQPMLGPAWYSLTRPALIRPGCAVTAGATAACASEGLRPKAIGTPAHSWPPYAPED